MNMNRLYQEISLQVNQMQQVSGFTGHSMQQNPQSKVQIQRLQQLLQWQQKLGRLQQQEAQLALKRLSMLGESAYQENTTFTGRSIHSQDRTVGNSGSTNEQNTLGSNNSPFQQQSPGFNITQKPGHGQVHARGPMINFQPHQQKEV
jgi:hypothetical protein